MIAINVELCPRCGGKHNNLKAKNFTKREVFRVYTYWAMCPNLNEPILIDPGIEQKAIDDICKEEDRRCFSTPVEKRQKHA